MRTKSVERQHVTHPFAPVWDERSRILILGSLPSVKSRETEFYYGHPQNRFWKVLAAVAGQEIPKTVEEKTRFLLEQRIAVWDVIASCEIEGSSDSSIQNVVPNDVAGLLQKSNIQRVFTNGGKAAQLYNRYILPAGGQKAVRLPSTSPANAAWPLGRLTEEWKQILRTGDDFNDE